MEHHFALTIDPGVSNGLAMWSDGFLVATGTFTTEELIAMLMISSQRCGYLVLGQSKPFSDVSIVVERPYCSGPNFNHAPFESLGAIHAAVSHFARSFAKYHEQSPGIMAGAKQRVPASVWKLFRNEHERDAVAHGLAFFKRTDFPSPRDVLPNA